MVPLVPDSFSVAWIVPSPAEKAVRMKEAVMALKEVFEGFEE